MHRTTTAAALIALILLACAAPPPTKTAWTKDGGSAAQLNQARDYCVAENESAEPGGGSEWLNARLVGNHFVRCMESKGWTRVPVHEE